MIFCRIGIHSYSIIQEMKNVGDDDVPIIMAGPVEEVCRYCNKKKVKNEIS